MIIQAVLALTLCSCSVGPDFVKPTPASPQAFGDWHGGDAATQWQSAGTAGLREDWWRAYNDPVLDELQQRAYENSPNLATAALHLAQARAQRGSTAAEAAPQLSLSGSATRQRQSENGASTRLYDALGADTGALAELLGKPYDLYQAGVDASWELDLWGRIRRSIEAADADVAEQRALLRQARVTLAADVATAYFDLRTTQRQLQAAREDVASIEQYYALMDARQQAGVISGGDLQVQRGELANARAALPALEAQQVSDANQLTLLLGARPGDLAAQLAPVERATTSRLPDLALGLPSEIALRRPDILAAEARLHSATAAIGVSRADLYPSIRLGGQFGYESYLSGAFSDWGSRTWSIGPSLDLPLFDRGKRKRVVELRELQQQEAAIAYHQTVLGAWQEIDDALSTYTSDRKAAAQQQIRLQSAEQTYELAQSRYGAGTTDFLEVLERQRSYLQARRDWLGSLGQLDDAFVRVNRVIGNGGDQ